MPAPTSAGVSNVADPSWRRDWEPRRRESAGYPCHVDANIWGEPVETCGQDPVTGFYRDGCCSTGPDDLGSHTVCAVVTREFLEHQREIGNDLMAPRPEYLFPGLMPGDRWCVCASRWRESYDAGIRTPVVLRATNAAALRIVPREALLACAVDVPDDPSLLVQ